MSCDFLFFLQGLRETSPEFVTQFFNVLSLFMSGAAALIVASVVYWSVNKKAGQYIMGAFLFSCTIAQGFKNCICQLRPWILDPRIHVASVAAGGATGFSMPSIHSTASVSFYGSSAILLKKRKCFVIVLLTLAFLTAFSRLWLGCHTLVDVSLGLLFGVMGIAIVQLIRSYLQKGGSDIALSVFGIVFGIVYLAFFIFKGYTIATGADGLPLVDVFDMQTDCFSFAGALIGISISWLIERRFIDFSTDGLSVKTRIIRAFIGAVIVLLFYGLIIPNAFAFLDDHWYHFAKYFVLVLIIVVVYPACFKAFEKFRSLPRHSDVI